MDKANQIFQKNRLRKQYFMGVLFLIIIAAGWRYPLLGYFIPLCMLLGVGIGLAQGRKWCDWFCPRGSFYDSLISRVSPHREIPSLFKKPKVRITVLIVLMAVMTVNLFFKLPDGEKIGNFFVMLLTLTTFFGITLALAFDERSWCFICPIGTVINLLGRSRDVLRIDSDLCIECKMCGKVCPLQIKPYISKCKGIQVIKDKDCLRCGSCVAVCPKKALNRCKIN